MNSKILKLEILGIVFIVILGSFLHFTFELSGKNIFVGTFSAVNESTWEHLKLAFFPALLWLLIELKFLKEKPKNFFLAKTKGVYLMLFLIVAIFYFYKAILGKDYLIFDILTFVIAVILGQLTSYKLMFWQNISLKHNKIALGFLIILLLSFVVFTFYPPKIFIFQDPISKNFGIF